MESNTRMYRVDQTRDAVRVIASYDPTRLASGASVLFPQGCFSSFGEVYKYFGDHYRDTQDGVRLDMFGVPPEEKRLLWGQWLGAENRRTARQREFPAMDPAVSRVLHEADDECVPCPAFEAIKARLA